MKFAKLGMVLGTLPWLVLVFIPTSAPTLLRPVPLRDLVEVLRGDPRAALVQVVGNLLVLAAFGLFAARCWPTRFWPVIVVAAAVAVSIETLQYALDLGRVASSDDLLLNTAGAALAFAIGRRIWSGRLARWRWCDVTSSPTSSASPRR
jgi:glycopeptide antibiotics resistance protein